jgi:transposase
VAISACGHTGRGFSRWADKGVWQALFARLCEDADVEEVFLARTIVRAVHPKKRATKYGPLKYGPLSWGLEYKDLCRR